MQKKHEFIIKTLRGGGIRKVLFDIVIDKGIIQTNHPSSLRCLQYCDANHLRHRTW